MKQEIITNKITNNIKNIIEKIGEKSDYVKVAVAFFSDNEIIEK